MRKTKCVDVSKNITVDIETLKGMLGVGRASATMVAEQAGAVVQIGRRKLYNVKKIEDYINNL